MAFKITEWAYSEAVEEKEMEYSGDSQYYEPEPGVLDLKIKYAKFTPPGVDESGKPNGEYYDVFFTQPDQFDSTYAFKIRYYLSYAYYEDKTDSWVVKPSKKPRNALIRLGKALAGTPIGIPLPESIIGGVVRGKVVYEESKNGKAYPKLYLFTTCDKEYVAAYSEIEQAFVDEVDDTVFEVE